MSGGDVYTLTGQTYENRPVWGNDDFVIRSYGNSWIWQTSLDSPYLYKTVSESTLPWLWTGSVKAVCSCPTGSTLVTARSSNWGKCISDVVSPCAEGFVRLSPSAACTPCSGYEVASGTTCVCPAGYTGAGCTPPAQIALSVSGAIDTALSGSYVFVGSNLTAAGARFPVYVKVDRYWPATPLGSSDVYLSYVEDKRAWALSSLLAAPGKLKFAFTNSANVTIALPLGSILPALAFNASDALSFSSTGTFEITAGFSVTPSQVPTPSQTRTQAPSPSMTQSPTPSSTATPASKLLGSPFGDLSIVALRLSNSGAALSTTAGNRISLDEYADLGATSTRLQTIPISSCSLNDAVQVSTMVFQGHLTQSVGEQMISFPCIGVAPGQLVTGAANVIQSVNYLGVAPSPVTMSRTGPGAIAAVVAPSGLTYVVTKEGISAVTPAGVTTAIKTGNDFTAVAIFANTLYACEYPSCSVHNS